MTGDREVPAVEEIVGFIASVLAGRSGQREQH